MDPFNALSPATAARMIPPLREAPPTKVTSCALVTSTDLEKALDVVKDIIGGVGAPSVIMGGRPAKSPGRPAAVGGRLTPLEVGQPSPAHQSSPTAQGRGSHPVWCPFPSSDDRERAPFAHTDTSFYGCPYPEEDNHLVLAGGSVKQQ
jgi:hypothetical protein